MSLSGTDCTNGRDQQKQTSCHLETEKEKIAEMQGKKNHIFCRLGIGSLYSYLTMEDDKYDSFFMRYSHSCAPDISLLQTSWGEGHLIYS